ncbi:hypothetical protein [Sphingobacterium kitahiroshimense]|uniref:Uncharacterized protein n=1 Tax=Sphingobacterium kitahiroshimense TaxID=470446 RepID=A0ABV0BXB1_9SPHI
MTNKLNNQFRSPYKFNERKRGKFSLSIIVSLGTIILPLSAYLYFNAFNEEFGIHDFLASDLIRILYRLAYSGIYIGAAAMFLFLLFIIPIVAFRLHDFLSKKVAPTNRFVGVISFVFGILLWLAWITFVKNEVLWPNASDLAVLILAELVIFLTVFVRREIFYSLFLFLPVIFSQRGRHDAELVQKIPYTFKLEYTAGEVVKEVVLDGKVNLYIDQSETVLYYKELKTGKLYRIAVADIVSTSKL